MAVLALILAQLTVPAPPLRGVATIYSPDDLHGGGNVVGCPAITLARYGTRRLLTARKRVRLQGRYLVAMRPAQAPCGALVKVCGVKTGKCITGERLDSGPWGSLCPDYRRPVKLPKGCKRIGLIDLPPDAGRKILPGDGGRGDVRVWVLP